MSSHWHTVETSAGPVRVEETAAEVFRVYEGRHPGGEVVGSFAIERGGLGGPVWLWRAGGEVTTDHGAADSESDAIEAILQNGRES
jgi:hypothetical protein